MLDALRKSAASWVAKLFIALLVLSFAVWGVADIFRGYRGTEVARVGETEITVEQFRNSLQREIQQASQQVGTYLTLDQARAMGLDRRVLGRLITEAALDEEARRRGLGMPDAVVAESIQADPSFRAPGGQFDRSYFEQVLRASGYSEAAFVEEQRKRLLRSAIAESVAGDPEAPEVLVRSVDRYRNEERTADYLVVSEDMIAQPEEPTEEALKTYYENNIADFRAPEYRRVELLELQPEDIADEIEVSEEDARASYESRASQFSTPERRTIEQIPFESMEAARAVREEIAGGKSFEDVAAERGISADDLALGTLTRQQVVDPKIAEAAFGLQENAVSDPVDGTFSPVLLRVTKIEEGSTKSYEDVADEVKKQLALDRAANKVLDLYDFVEDDRAAGLTFREIAEKRDLPFRTIEAIDRQGRGADGAPIADLPDTQGLLNNIFSTEPGVEADALQIGRDGYLWFNMLDVTEARDRSLEEAREDVVEAWRRDQVAQRIAERAREIADQLRGGAKPADVAEELGTEGRTVGPVKRNGTAGPFGPAAVGSLFTTPKNEVAVAAAREAPQRVVFRVTGITVPEYQPQADDPYVNNIATGLSNDMLGQYLAELQTRLGVRVNQQALQQAFGQTEGS